jgi:uncharacterized protein involved in oxidation of intracellular sulfur
MHAKKQSLLGHANRQTFPCKCTITLDQNLGVDRLETITMILQTAPYGDERVWNAFRLARALTTAVINVRANIFLTGDAVTTAKIGQKPPEGYYNLEGMLKELIGKGIEVIACRTCIAARGLTQGELIEGVQIGTTVGNLAKWIKESSVILNLHACNIYSTISA